MIGEALLALFNSQVRTRKFRLPGAMFLVGVMSRLLSGFDEALATGCVTELRGYKHFSSKE
jgi:hypothetical protein